MDNIRIKRQLLATLFIYTCVGLNYISCRKHKPIVDVTTDVTTEAINSTCILVKWATKNSLEPSPDCPTVGYTVRLKQDSWRRAKSWTMGHDVTSTTLCDLKPNTRYTARVVSESCEGRRKTSRRSSIRTSLGRHTKDIKDYERGQSSSLSDDQPPGRPTRVGSRPQADSVFISWEPPEAGGPVVRGYMIGYGEGVPDVNWQYLESHRRNVTIKNLKKSTQYVLSVRAFNDVDKGPVVYELVYTSDNPDSPPGDWPAPTDVRVSILSPTTVFLQWTDPSLGHVQRIDDNRYYNVHYQATPAGRTMSVIVKDLHVTLHDLTPSTWYEFKVRTNKDGQTSEFSEATKNKTYDDAEEGVHITQNRPSSVSVSSVSRSYNDDSSPGHDPNPADDDARNNRDVAFNTAAVTNNDEDKKSQFQHTSHYNTPLEQLETQPVVTFKSLIQVKVSAYITWPDSVGGSCDDVTEVVGYRLRYSQSPDDVIGVDVREYVTQNLSSNFILLENLMVNSMYTYQVKYLMKNGTSTEWSASGKLDTHFESN